MGIKFNLYHSPSQFIRRQFDDIFLSFPRKQVLTFLHIVSNGDKIHELSNLFSEENKKKYFKMLSAEIFTQSAMH